MADQRIEFPSWYNENETTNYPFADTATLTNGNQTILAGTFLDAVLHIIGAGANQYLCQVVISNSVVTLWFGDENNRNLASGKFNVINPPTSVPLYDIYNRPAGLIVSTSLNLSSFTAWGVGTFNFDFEETGFVATVCIPTPEVGLQGIKLPDGTVVTGDVWIVGGEGVVVSQDLDTGGIIVSAVGDPLFKRAVCQPATLFNTPRLLETITFKDGYQRIVAGPDLRGSVKITVNNQLVEDTVLRIRPVNGVVTIDAVGSTLLET